MMEFDLGKEVGLEDKPLGSLDFDLGKELTLEQTPEVSEEVETTSVAALEEPPTPTPEVIPTPTPTPIPSSTPSESPASMDSVLGNIVKSSMFMAGRKQSVGSMMESPGDDLGTTELNSLDMQNEQQVSLIPDASTKNRIAARAMNQKDFERGIKSYQKDFSDGQVIETARKVAGVGEGVVGAASGMLAFTGGLITAGVTAPAALLGKATEEGSMTKQQALEAGDITHKAMQVVMEEMTYAPRRKEGQKIMEVASWPFAKAYEFIEAQGKERGWSDEAISTAQLAFDVGLVVTPKVAKSTLKLAKQGARKIAEGKLPTELELKANENLRKQGDDWADLSVIEEANKIIEEPTKVIEGETTKLIENQRQDQLLLDWEEGRSEISNPREIEIQQEAAMAESLGKDEGYVVSEKGLEELYTKYQEDKAKSNNSLDVEIGRELETDSYYDYVDKLEDGEVRDKILDDQIEAVKQNLKIDTQKATDKIYLQESQARVEGNKFFTDAEKTEANGLVLNDTATAKRGSIDPEFTLNQQINNTNKYLHNDAGIDIATVKGVISTMEDMSGQFRELFSGDKAFENFKTSLGEAKEFARVAENSKNPPNVTLSAGFNPGEFYSVIRDTIKGAKGLAGKINPKTAKNLIAKRAGLPEMAKSGVLAFLDDAAAKGIKVTQEDLQQAVRPLYLRRETTNKYQHMQRAFPKNKGYKEHVYAWDEPGFEYAEGHWGEEVAGTVMNSRISDMNNGKTRVVEQIQSDYFQGGGGEKAAKAKKAKAEKTINDIYAEIDTALEELGYVGGLEGEKIQQLKKSQATYLQNALDNGSITKDSFDKQTSKMDLFFARQILSTKGDWTPTKSVEMNTALARAEEIIQDSNMMQAPFEKTWINQVLMQEIKDAINSGAEEFAWSDVNTTLKSVLGFDLINKPEIMSAEKYIKNEHGEKVWKQARPLINRYDKSIPKEVKRLLQGTDGKIESVASNEWKTKSYYQYSNLIDSFNKRTNELELYPDGNTPEVQTANALIGDLAGEVEQSTAVSSADSLRLPQIQKMYEALDGTPVGDKLESFGTTVKAEIAKIKSIEKNITYPITPVMSSKLRKARMTMAIVKQEMRSTVIGHSKIKLTESVKKKFSGEQGISLRSGVGSPKEFVEAVSDIGKEMKRKFDSKFPLAASSATIRLGKARTSIFDVSGNSKAILDAMNTNEAWNAHRALVLRQGATTAAGIQISQMRDVVYSGIGQTGRGGVDQIMFLKRVIDIDKARAAEAIKTGKNVRLVNHPKIPAKIKKQYGLTGDTLEYNAATARKVLINMKADLGAEKFEQLSSRAEIGFSVMGDMLNKLADEGLITPELHAKLKDTRYLKRKNLLDTIDPTHTYRIGKKKLEVRESGVESLKKGSIDDLLEMDSELLMSEVINATYGRIANNNSNLALVDIAKTNPSNPIVRIPVEMENGKMTKKPEGWQEVKYYEQGTQETMWIEPEFADGWITGNREISHQLARIVNHATGNSMLKYTATGINPDFALKSLIRDPLQIFMASEVKVGEKFVSTYSDKLPIFALQYGQDLMAVASDSILRKGRWNDARLDGMGMGFMSGKTGKASKKNTPWTKPLGVIGDALTYFNTTSEILSRLSTRERAMRKVAQSHGMSMKEFNELNQQTRVRLVDGATVKNPRLGETTREQQAIAADVRKTGSFAGRSYMDFGNYGTKGKAVDSFIPFLNAAMQATRGMGRSAIHNPAGFTSKATQLASVTGLIYAYNKYKHNDDLDKVPEYVKRNNLVLMTGIEFPTADGSTGRMYFKIPKDPGQVGLLGLVEGLIDQHVFGEEVNSTELFASLALSVGPTNTIPVPPIIQGLMGAFTNTDIKQSVRKGRPTSVWNEWENVDELKTEEYDSDTAPWAVTAGQFFGQSPAHIEHTIDSMFADNMFGELAANSLNEMIGSNDRQNTLTNQVWAETIRNFPLIKNFVGFTGSESLSEKEEDYKQKNIAKADSFMVDAHMETLITGFLENGNVEYSEIIDYASANSKHADRLLDKVKYAETLKEFGGEYKRFWNRMRGGTTTEVKANMYYRRWKKEDEAGRDELDFHRRVFGFNSEEFRRSLVGEEIKEEERQMKVNEVKQEINKENVQESFKKAIDMTIKEENPKGAISKNTLLDNGSVGKGKNVRNGIAYPYMFYVKDKGWEVDRGYGDKIKTGLSKKAAEELVKKTTPLKLSEAKNKAVVKLTQNYSKIKEKLPNIDPARQAILATMKYQGADATTWTKAGNLIGIASKSGKESDWKNVRKELENSLWARQTPERAKRTIDKLISGIM